MKRDKCDFCGGPMTDTGPPINENYCANDKCTAKYIVRFNRGVKRMIKVNEERRIAAVQEITGSRAKAIKIIKVLKEMV